VIAPKPITLFKRLRYDDSQDECELAEERQVRRDFAKLRIQARASDGAMTSDNMNP